MNYIPMIKAELDFIEDSISQHDRLDDPKFDSYEIALYEILWITWTEELKELSKSIPPEEYEEFVRRVLGPLFSIMVAPSVGRILTDMYFTGRKIVGDELGISVIWSKHDERAIKFLTDYTNFWIGSYYDRHLGEEISKIIREGLQDGLSTVEIGDKLEKLLSGKVPPEKLPRLAKGQYPWMYWRGLARNAITRARNAAIISSLEDAGIEYYEIRAVRDGRTCPVCRNMHGRIFKVSDGKKHVDTFMRMRDPESVKKKFPFAKLDDVLVPSDSLKLAHKLPPFHFNCRCTFVARFESIEEEADKFWKDENYRKEFMERMFVKTTPKGVWTPETKEEALWMVKIARKEVFTKKEIEEFLKGAKWAHGKFEVHLAKHSRSFQNIKPFKGKLTEERYSKIIGRVFKDGQVYGVIDERTGYPQLWVIAEIEGDNEHLIRAVIDVKGKPIRTVHPIKESKLNKEFRKVEMRYNIRGKRKKITLKALVMKMKWNREAVRGFAGAYYDVISWVPDVVKRENEIPYWDIDAAMSYRTDVVEHLDLADSEAKEYLRKADEIVLNNLDLYVKSGDTHYPPKPTLFWHEYLDWVKEGRLKVEWDDKLGIYVGKLVK